MSLLVDYVSRMVDGAVQSGRLPLAWAMLADQPPVVTPPWLTPVCTVD